MQSQPELNFYTLGLNLEQLSTAYKVQTNWHVITGAPCCGKTTLIDLLAAEGFQTIPEVGRAYLEDEIAKGRKLDEIRASEAAFTITIQNLQRQVEEGLLADQVIFMDRGFPDALTFFRIRGLDPHQVLPECFHHRYASVFVLDRFPIQRDGIRTEDGVMAEFMDEWLARDYGALGYSVVRVPAVSPEERVDFVLETLIRQGLI